MTCRRHKPYAILFFVVLLISGCSGGSKPGGSSEQVSSPVASTTPVSINKDDYPVFPNADAGADPSVPAEQGGKGFKGDGWETNATFDLIGDPRAVKGGVFREANPDFPTTLRVLGLNSNNLWNGVVLQGLVYETLIVLDPDSLDYIPALATHWQISPDKLTYRFRIDPNARFNDGTPVTADDVIATWKLNIDKSIQDPFH